ncbi:hypothetical protein BBBOND_0312800 [Babesia bigemina]|uniref:Extracellular matrix-binding ebh n=1 Tax=Babesia bigemina TaxID=5866 RepID=A0A061DBQ0_BABBI|nr:hypothetical protein BBBOND_0312800 [Babesia bigemina]CDR97377.1 hypothetical protein BBBOND_0312800 [Babesia bigemina]|eukprot:XP_012769563.1 hypothetical protein BBBOND_0312800 [Babesia bigemina]
MITSWRTTKPSGSSVDGPESGTAQAVDKAIDQVREDVKGIDGKFESDVKQPLDTAVKELEGAVDTFNEQAKQQVKDAAKGAIDKAANVISTQSGESKIDLQKTMPNFHNAHKEITTNLKPKLEKLLNDHIGRDDTSDGKKDQVKLSKDFKKYDKQVYIGSITDKVYGPLSLAIEKVRDEGLMEINKHVGKRSGVGPAITDKQITDSFKAIKKQLEGIVELVSDRRIGYLGESINNSSGLRTFLKQLQESLGDKQLGDVKGLDAITKVIAEVQKGTLEAQPKAIGEAVTAIKLELEVLKKKLISDSDSDKSPVINALRDLKNTGLASGTWNGKGGSPVDGLKKIQEHLKDQNEELPKQTKLIDAAIDDIRYELFQVGIRLNHKNETDDVIDQLDWLRRKIGISDAKPGNLLKIISEISRLWAGKFSVNPDKIALTINTIKARLQGLRGLLEGDQDNDVIATLKDLKEVGLSKNFWKKNENEKGLQLIESCLKYVQTTVSQQPREIELGVEQITKELEGLRTALKDKHGDPNNDVINQLEILQKNGLGADDNPWKGNASGLGKIRSKIQGQNAKLAEASDNIKQATESVLQETETLLKSAKHKLSPDLIAEDGVVQNLKTLEEMIKNSGGITNNNLKDIYDTISGLQNQAFKNNPENIGQAEREIANGLRKLQSELDGHVTNPLRDVIQQGLGGGDKWNGHDAKSFDHIESNLERQQRVLTDQPEIISSGMKEITDELQSLRTELQGTDSDDPENRGVIRNLQFMTTHIGGSDKEGIKKIKREMESLKNDQGKDITKHLNIMSSAITNAAGNLAWNLGELENSHIDGKLKGIQDGLDNLRLTELAEAIRLCDDFLRDADEIERNTIADHWKHVDDEVDDGIKELTKEARRLYVDSVREALELFAKKVTEDLEQLQNEINRDRYVGYKGFMRYLQGPLSSDLTGDEQSVAELSSAFQEVFEQIKKYVAGEITRLHDEQNKEKNPSLPPTEEPYTPKLNDVYEVLTELLAYLKDYDDGADRLTELVERLTKALSNLVPSDFKHPSTPLLDTVSRGLNKFAAEFYNTYISAYSGQRCREEHAHKYAKVLLSRIPMTYNALTKLATKCEGEWKPLHISMLTTDDRDNALGNYLTRCGYRVSSNYAVQQGELRCDMLGGGIYELLVSPIPDVSIELMVDGEPIKNGITLYHIISLLYDALCNYFQACHIYVPPKPRYPCTVKDMLSWLSGLQYTRIADNLPDHCKALLNRRCHDGDTPNRDDPIMGKCIESLPYTIAATCSRSTALLTVIQGNGHGFDLAAYPYSVDFSNNRARLHYPANPAELLDMLRDIACRLCKVLYFLYSQCCRSTTRVGGWRECTYGRQIQSHNWQCKQFTTYSSISTTAAATTTTSSTTTSNPGCPHTSPLQSFLSDSCHGLLPHTLTAVNMAIDCANCKANEFGQQCLTPLGFWDLGFAASITVTGWDLAKRLGDMCRDADACLFVLYRTLSLLCPTAPSSLADVFALYAQVLRQWDPHDRVEHRGGTYTDASDFISHLNTDGIDSLFPLWTQLHGSYDNNTLTTAISSLAGHDHKSHDALSSLLNDSTCQSPSGCTPYLQPLGLHAHHSYPKKHAVLYITWIMYLVWQLWGLLCDLLHALDNIDCTASGCATCPCQPGTHGGKDTCHCPSIVQCAGPLPTLYRYGFTYRNANLLVTDNYAMRCGDLNTQLKQALHSGHFTELFHQIDQLTWHIRMPFLHCFIALWSLVALYILHTFLHRMDVLYIRSHLMTTKASHLIDVKALLIPSRQMLSLYDASYFDDDPNELLNLRY